MPTLSILHIGGGYLPPALKALGHNVLHVSPMPHADLTIPHPMLASRLLERVAATGFAPDALIYEDNGNLPQFIGLENLPWPSVFYSIDTFCNPWHIPFGNAFDHTFVAQRAYAGVFLEQGRIRAEWLPLFWTRDLPQTLEAPWTARDIPVAFVGTLDPVNIPSRKPFLETFRRLQALFCMTGDYLPIFARSRIALNQTAAAELNFRCFEAPICGPALLMEDCPELEELFRPGEDILPPYRRGDAAHAATIAQAWLERPRDLERVARNGQERVRARHSAQARAARLAEALLELGHAKAPEHRLTELSQRQRLLSSAYAILALELDNPRLAAHKTLYGELFCAMMPS